MNPTPKEWVEKSRICFKIENKQAPLPREFTGLSPTFCFNKCPNVHQTDIIAISG